MSNRHAFTLIELLVVVTIIVVLLALLTPALDKAIRQAELASCGARIRSVVGGVTLYTGDFRRYYPYRPMVDLYPGMTPIGWLNNGLDNMVEARADDRPIFRNHIPVNASLNCPLNADLDIEGSKREPTVTYTYSGYALWFGFYYRGLQGGMRKLGDRLTGLDWAGAPYKSYSLLASDFSVVHRTQKFGYSGHPDADGAWPQATFQDGPNPWDGSYNITLAWYFGSAPRGVLDLNYGYTDGSVERLTGVAFDPSPGDDRFDYLIESTGSVDTNRTIQVPTGR